MIIHRPTPSSNPQNRQPEMIPDSAAKIHIFLKNQIFSGDFFDKIINFEFYAR